MNDAERDAVDHLDRLNGINELRAAVLALLLPPGSKRAVRAWRFEVAGCSRAVEVRDWVLAFSPANRLPWFEVLVSRWRNHAPDQRAAMLESTRRVMGARGVMRPIDRLHWLAMRLRMGDSSAAATRTAATSDLSQLPQREVSTIASYCAFLARMVPSEPAELEETAPTDAGRAWYDTVMQPWAKRSEIPPCEPPDTDKLVYALQELQAMPWMQRPALVRGWVAGAVEPSKYGRWNHTAAGSLRLTCSLLDSPLPPEPERHYGTAAPKDTMA